MPPGLHDRELLRVAKAKKEYLASLRLGAYIVEKTGRALSDLEIQVCSDRLSLASQFSNSGARMLRMRPPQYRNAVSRYYYSMYHTARAVVFFCNKGDDFEAHSELPHHIPDDFPNVAVWKNRLKDARLRRNDADYEPYPVLEADFSAIAKALSEQSGEFQAAAVVYLRSKGCPVP